MRTHGWLVLLGLVLFGAPAIAETALPSGSTARGITPDGTALVPGANSFSEGQARSLIEAQGYRDVSPLVNDNKGIWHGTAVKDGKTVNVMVDFKGHVDVQ